MRCHVTGFGYRGGFVSEIETPELAEVGCVECHGLLYYHPEKQKAKKVTESTCKKCHNQEWSPDFNFEDYRKRILH
jgi:NAD-dependent SIR2 family protein deacetylase